MQYNSLKRTFTFYSGGQKRATEESGSLPQCVRGESRTLLTSKQHNQQPSQLGEPPPVWTALHACIRGCHRQSGCPSETCTEDIQEPI